jgi:hypothetical protein
MSDLIKTDASDVMPFKALPSEELRTKKVLEIGIWLDRMLSLSGDQSVKRLEVLLPMIKDHAWSYSTKEIKEAFTAYVTGKLAIEPRDNYLSVILFNKVMNLYRDSMKIHKPKQKMSEELKLTDEEMKMNAYLNCIHSFDNYKSKGIMDRSDWAVYDELDSRRLLNFTKEEKKTAHAITVEKNPEGFDGLWIEKSKIALLERFYLGLIAKGRHIKELL